MRMLVVFVVPVVMLMLDRLVRVQMLLTLAQHSQGVSAISATTDSPIPAKTGATLCDTGQTR